MLLQKREKRKRRKRTQRKKIKIRTNLTELAGGIQLILEMSCGNALSCPPSNNLKFKI